VEEPEVATADGQVPETRRALAHRTSGCHRSTHMVTVKDSRPDRGPQAIRQSPGSPESGADSGDQVDLKSAGGRARSFGAATYVRSNISATSASAGSVDRATATREALGTCDRCLRAPEATVKAA
jgi:hypothetical protein